MENDYNYKTVQRINDSISLKIVRESFSKENFWKAYLVRNDKKLYVGTYDYGHGILHIQTTDIIVFYEISGQENLNIIKVFDLINFEEIVLTPKEKLEHFIVCCENQNPPLDIEIINLEPTLKRRLFYKPI